MIDSMKCFIQVSKDVTAKLLLILVFLTAVISCPSNVQPSSYRLGWARPRPPLLRWPRLRPPLLCWPRLRPPLLRWPRLRPPLLRWPRHTYRGGTPSGSRSSVGSCRHPRTYFVSLIADNNQTDYFQVYFAFLQSCCFPFFLRKLC